MRHVLRPVLLTAILAASAGAVLIVAPLAAAAATSGTYHAVPPARILDTIAHPVAANGEVALRVTGAAPLVPGGASAVVLNVTVVGPTSGGFVSVFPDGVAAPHVEHNVDFVRAQTAANLVVVSVPADGIVRLYHASPGTVRLIAGVFGYFTGASAPSGQGSFGARAPTRVLNTGPVAARHVVSVPVTGAAVPAGVSAVVLNVTVAHPTTSGFLTAYADGASRPSASNLNFRAGQAASSLLVVPVGADGRVDLYNGSDGTVTLLADLSGYFLAGDPVAAGALGALAPVRVLDTRTGVGAPAGAVGAGQSRTLTVAGRGGVPLARVAAVVLDVTAVTPTAGGSLSVYQAGATRTSASNVYFQAGQTVPNLVVTAVSPGGRVTIYNASAGTVHIVAEVAGYVLNSPAPLPATASTSRYVRNVTATSDVTVMHDEGMADAAAGSRFVLLDIGAQLNNRLGVALTATAIQLTYAKLVSAVQAYLNGFGSVPGATVAVGTNNGGDFSVYPAAARGADWANKVVDPLVAASGVTLAAANDIEGGFSSTQAQAWEGAYLANTSANLIFNGSADGCPTTFGATGRTCSFGWTQAQYYTLAHNGTRIRALPQVYVAGQAVQWANIDATGGKGIVFAGALTEFAACPTVGSGCSIAALPPSQGWAALYHALSTIITTPSVAALTDLRVDS